MKTENINVQLLEVNKGQIEGLPKNPRFIRDTRFEQLKKSIEDAPEMLGLRELIVMPHGKKYVVIGGNMRLRACLDLGYTEIPCKVLDKDTPAEKLREYAIKDNNGFGQDDWCALENEWDDKELEKFGMNTMWRNDDGDDNIGGLFDEKQQEKKEEKTDTITISFNPTKTDKDEIISRLNASLTDYAGITIK